MDRTQQEERVQLYLLLIDHLNVFIRNLEASIPEEWVIESPRENAAERHLQVHRFIQGRCGEEYNTVFNSPEYQRLSSLLGNFASYMGRCEAWMNDVLNAYRFLYAFEVARARLALYNAGRLRDALIRLVSLLLETLL